MIDGIEYKLWLDFDAGRSVVEIGNGNYILKPVIRIYSEATSGAIKGSVLPPTHIAQLMLYKMPLIRPLLLLRLQPQGILLLGASGR